MRIKKLTAAALCIIMLLSVCACAKTTTPLWKLYEGERVKNLGTQLPDTINIRVDTPEFSVSVYDCGDEELIKKAADAFLAVTAGKETSGDNFRQEYSVDFVWDDEIVSAVMNKDTAAVYFDSEVKYYEISGADDFILLLSNLAAEEEKVSVNADKVIDEQNLTVEISKNGSFNENGDYLIDLNVLNNRSDTIAVRLSGVKADKAESEDSGILYVSGNSELGFRVPIILPEKGSFNKISFKIEVGIGTQEPFEAFITSSDYVIKAD